MENEEHKNTECTNDCLALNIAVALVILTVPSSQREMGPLFCVVAFSLPALCLTCVWQHWSVPILASPP